MVREPPLEPPRRAKSVLKLCGEVEGGGGESDSLRARSEKTIARKTAHLLYVILIVRMSARVARSSPMTTPVSPLRMLAQKWWKSSR